MPLTFVSRYLVASFAPTVYPNEVFSGIDAESVRAYTQRNLTRLTVYYFGFYR